MAAPNEGLDVRAACALAASLPSDGALDSAALVDALETALATLPPHAFEKFLRELDFRAVCALRLLAARTPDIAQALAVHAQVLDDSERRAAFQEEERARVTLAAAQPYAPQLVDARLLLSPYAYPELFVRAAPPHDAQTLILLLPDEAAPPPPLGAPSVVSQAQFEENFRVTTMNRFDGVNFNNLLIAGGAVEACATLQPPPPGARDYMLTRFLLSKMYGTDALRHLTESPSFLPLHAPDSEYAKADVDVYIFGLNAEAAAAKAAEVVAVIEHNITHPHGYQTGHACYVTQSTRAISILTAWPFRIIQIITVPYTSAAAALMDFDLDCCCVGTRDGRTPEFLPRGLLAVNTRCHVLGLDKPRRLHRVDKYAQRGYVCLLPERFFNNTDHDEQCVLGAARAAKLFSAAKVLISDYTLLNDGSIRTSDAERWIAGVSVHLPLVGTRWRNVLFSQGQADDDELAMDMLVRKVYGELPNTTPAADAPAFENELEHGFSERIMHPDDATWHMSGTVMPYGPPFDVDAKLVHHIPTSCAGIADMIERAQPDWPIASTTVEIQQLALGANFHYRADPSGMLSYSVTMDMAERTLVVPAAADSPLRRGPVPVSFHLSLLGFDWRLDLSTDMRRDVRAPADGHNMHFSPALVMSLTLLSISSPDPLLRSHITLLWPPAAGDATAQDDAPQRAADGITYRLVPFNIEAAVLNEGGDDQNVAIDDHLLVPFITYDSDGNGTHTNTDPAVVVPPLARPAATAADWVMPDAALTPSRTWRNHIFWDYMTQPAIGDDPFAHQETREHMKRHYAGFFDADGNLRLRLRLQVGRLERARDITAFPPPPGA